MHAYMYTGMCAHARVPATKRDRFTTLKLGLEQIPHHLRATSNPYFPLYKALNGRFSRGENFLEENTQDSLENGESKREFFNIYHKVNIFLIDTFYGFDLQVSKVY